MRHNKEIRKSNLHGNYIVSLDYFFGSCLSKRIFSLSFVLRKKVFVFGVFSVVFSRNWSECGDLRCKSQCLVRMKENNDQKNFKYGHFSRIVVDHYGLLWVVVGVIKCGSLWMVRIWIFFFIIVSSLDRYGSLWIFF